MGNYGKKLNTTGLALTLIASALLAACDNNETKNDTTNPNPDTFTPKGTVVGILTDSQTGEPVVGAVIDIGIAKTTTDDTGHFVLQDVSPNTFINNGLITGAYTAVINTAGVTSPINQKSSAYTGPRYADKDTTCNFMNVVFTSLGEVSAGTGTTSTNHDTQVKGLVATTQMTIGKMSGSISGVVYDTDGETPVEGVKIDATVGDNIGNEAGASPCPSGTTLINQYDITTDADGKYSINGIEAGFTPTVRAYTTDNSKTASSTLPVMVEGRSYDGDNGANLMLGLNDSVGPVLLSTSIENNQDIAVDGNAIDVVFKFNEAIIDSEYTTNTVASASTSGVNTLYSDVNVTYNGAKAGNVAHSVSWNSGMTELTVSIPAAAVAATSSYTVSIASGQAAGRITDAAGNVYTQATGVNDTINFTTNGGTDLSGTAPTAAVANAMVDYNTFPVMLDWLPVTGAASYNVYRSATIGANAVALELVGNVTTSSFADADKTSSNANGDSGADCSYPTYTTCNGDGTTGDANNGSGAENRGGTGLVSGESKVTYSYMVAAVNTNGDEGAMSTAVAVSDTDTPSLVSIATNAVTDADGDGNCETVTATFNEPLNEATAETAGSYSYNLGTTPGGTTLTATAASLTSSTTVKVTFDDATACASFSDDGDNSELFIVDAAVTDISGNAMATNGDTWHEDSATVD